MITALRKLWRRLFWPSCRCRRRPPAQPTRPRPNPFAVAARGAPDLPPVMVGGLDYVAAVQLVAEFRQQGFQAAMTTTTPGNARAADQ